MTPNNETNILVVMPMHVPEHWEILRGINAFSRDYRLPWLVRICDERGGIQWNKVRHAKPDIVLTQSAHPVHEFVAEDTPVVAIAPNLQSVSLWSCTHDDLAIGKAAAEYFLSKGFKRFAFATPVPLRKSNHASHGRELGFNSVLKAHGHASKRIGDVNLLGPTSTKEANKAGRMLESLASDYEPLAVFCFNDSVSYSIVESCHRHGIKVPQDVAVLGVDNNEFICEAMSPATSSITLDHYSHGYQSAKLAHALYCKAYPDCQSVALQPGSICTRASSDILLLADKAIAKAMRLLQEAPSGSIKVKDMIHVSGISRTLFEERFKKSIGHSPLQEIHRQRIHDTRQQLTETTRSVAEIADWLGFSDPYQLHKLFKKHTGMTPGAFRKSLKS